MAGECALTSNYSLAGCKDGIGGLANIYFIEKGNLSSYTKASGVVTALTKATGKQFYKYQLQNKTASYEENINSTPANGTISYQQVINIVLNRNDTATRNEILLLMKNQLAAVVEDKSGIYWLFGADAGLDGKGKRVSGTNGDDRNGYELSFEGEERELAPQVAADVAAALTTPG